MDDLTCRITLVLAIAVIAFLVYRWRFTWTYTGDQPVYFDLSDPVDEYEYRCTIEQRKLGRERGGEIITKGKLQ